MGYIKTYESFNESDLQIIKDILLDIEDEGFKIEYHYDSKFSIMHIFITNKNRPFYLDDIDDSVIRISNFLGKKIYGFCRGTSKSYPKFPSPGEYKFYIDKEDIIDEHGNKMSKNWYIYSMRLLIHH